MIDSSSEPTVVMRKHTILFLAANPDDTDELMLEDQARAIEDELRRSGHRDFEFKTRWKVEPMDLLRDLRALKPTIVHFSGPGGPNGLRFDSADGRGRVVAPDAIAAAFEAAGAPVKVVVLNACYTDVVAEALLAHIDCVVGTSGPLAGDAAKNFAIGFYGGLGEHASIAAAHRDGKAAIHLVSGLVSAPPQIRVRSGLDADQLFLAPITSAVDDEDSPQRRDVLRRYLHGLQNQLDRPFWAIRSPGEKRRLLELYLKPRLRDPASGSGELSADELLTRMLQGESFAISARAGAGKTALIDWLALCTVNRARGDLECGKLPEVIPIVFRKSAWKRRDPDAADGLPFSLRAAEAVDMYPSLERWLHSHASRLAVFVDGLGEVAREDSSRADEDNPDDVAIDLWREYVTRLIITRRPYIWDPNIGQTLEVLPLNDAEQELLYQRLGSSPRKMLLQADTALATSPLYLTLSCMIPEAEASSVTNAARLLDAAAWQILRESVDIDKLHTMMEFYEDLAWLIIKLTPASQVGPIAEKWMREGGISGELALRPRILVPGDKGLANAWFAHDAFKEFFAAGRIRRMVEKNETEASQTYEIVRTLGSDGTSYLLDRLAEDPKVFNRYTDQLFGDLTIQQYLYDIGALSASLPTLDAMRSGPALSPASRVLVLKFRAHALYGMGGAHKAEAIAALDELLDVLDEVDGGTAGMEARIVAWYRLWAADHRTNLSGEGAADVEVLLPPALRTGEAPTSGDEYFLLRAAHFWGHRGNQELRRQIKRQPVHGDAIACYLRAAAYRACAFKLSFPVSRAGSGVDASSVEHREEALQELDKIALPGWALAYAPSPSVCGDPSVEKFPSMHQALGDTAHQLVCSGIVHCWNTIEAPDEGALTRARKCEEDATSLWKLATKVGRRRERIRYVLRLAELRSVIAMIEQPARSADEALEQFRAALVEVKDRFEASAVVDRRAMEGMEESVLDFHRALGRS